MLVFVDEEPDVATRLLTVVWFEEGVLSGMVLWPFTFVPLWTVPVLRLSVPAPLALGTFPYWPAPVPAVPLCPAPTPVLLREPSIPALPRVLGVVLTMVEAFCLSRMSRALTGAGIGCPFPICGLGRFAVRALNARSGCCNPKSFLRIGVTNLSKPEKRMRVSNTISWQ